ncbi:MAG TPA: amidohydrolase family protein [Polyangia bacterium]|nr:amidohydrolase family protein [Polyangia bacterium]
MSTETTIVRNWKKTRFNEYHVIDGDRHVIEPLEAFTKYLDRSFRDRAPVLVRDNVYGSTRFLIEGRLYQKVAGAAQGRREGMSAYRPRGEQPGLSYEEATAWVCGRGKLKDMDDTGIDAALWIPTVGLYVPDILDADLQAAYCRALNNWFADAFCAENRDRLWFAATVPIDPEPARLEAARAVRELGARAVWIRPNVMQGRRWWDRSYDRLWEVLQDTGTPLVFHEATGAYHTTEDPARKFDTYWMAHVVSHPQEMTSALVALLGSGILERFPGLKVLFCEAGLSWFPYYLFRLDEHYETRRSEIPLARAPSEYFRRQCVVCSFEPEEALFAEATRWFGGKNVGATSDYPHWDSGGLNVLARYVEAFPELGEGERRDFLQNNLTDLFGVRWTDARS